MYGGDSALPFSTSRRVCVPTCAMAQRITIQCHMAAKEEQKKTHQAQVSLLAPKVATQPPADKCCPLFGEGREISCPLPQGSEQLWPIRTP